MACFPGIPAAELIQARERQKLSLDRASQAYWRLTVTVVSRPTGTLASTPSGPMRIAAPSSSMRTRVPPGSTRKRSPFSTTMVLSPGSSRTRVPLGSTRY